MDLVNLAKKSLGVNYVWGGNSLTSGVDCSGLIQQVYAAYGISLPRVTYQQIDAGAKVGMSNLRPGDMVFFATMSADQPDHVGMYIGGGKFIHAPKTGDVVKISNLSDSYYANRFLGGRRVAGVTGGTDGGDSGEDTIESAAKAQRMTGQELAETYGLSMAFFDSIPELRGLLDQAVADQWDPKRWTAALKNTKWWSENSDTQRQLRIMETSDPATFKATLNATVEQLKLQAVQMGAVIGDDRLNTTARMALASGWGKEQINSYLAQYIDFTDKNVMGGQAGAHYREINKTAYQNGVTLDDQTMKNYAAYIGRGISTLEETLMRVRQTAAGSYPAFSEQILAGQNVSDIAQPYIQMMSREMGVPYTGIDVFTPEVRNALNRRGQDGAVAPMSLDEFQRSLRSSSDWNRTSGAVQQVMGVGSQVLKAMGLA